MDVGRFTSAAGRDAYLRAYDAALATGPVPTSTEQVETSFGTVNAVTWAGDGIDPDPLVLVPGRSSGVPMWCGIVGELRSSTGRTIVALDALGDAGRSVQRAPLRSMADQATWVVEAVRALGYRRGHLVGHSFGGATAAAVAVHEAQSTATLVLIEPAFTLAWPPVSTFVWATLAVIPGPQGWRDRALAELGGVSVEAIRERSPVGEMIRIGATEYRAALPTPRPLPGERLAALRMPVFVALATRSLAGGRAAQRARSLIASAEVDVWPDTTHSLPMQVPASLAARIARFLDSTPAS